MTVIGLRIRELREARGLTSKGVSSKLGVNYTTYKNWENCVASPKVDLLPSLAEALGVQVGDLFNEESFDDVDWKESGRKLPHPCRRKLLDFLASLNEPALQ